MARSRVLRGQPVPRSRAKLRKRLDTRHGQYKRAALRAFIDGWLTDDREQAQLWRIDLYDFLRESAKQGGHEAERLRQLAIFLEEDCSASVMSKGWQVLKRVYDLATHLDPDDEIVWRSAGISALSCVMMLDERKKADRQKAALIWPDALNAALRAAELAPNNADILYGVGYKYYFAPQRDQKATALSWFERAAAIDPRHGWADLYRAHCLHDMSQWSQAAEAYAAIDPNAFSGPTRWRLDLARQQRALCLLRAGKRAAAIALFRLVIEQYDLLAPEDQNQWWSLEELDYPPDILIEAATGELAEELGDEILALHARVNLGLGALESNENE